MRLLIFPQYAYPVNHVVVNTVYEELLPARGHEVHMIRPMAGVEGPTRIAAPWPNGSMVVYPEAARSRNPLANAIASARERRWLSGAVRLFRDVLLDAVLVRNDLAAAGLARTLAKRRGIPFIYQLSSPDAELLMSTARDTRGALGGYLRLRSAGGLLLRRRISRRADAVLAISDAMRDYLIDSDGLQPDRVFSFPMGIPERPAPSAEAVAAIRTRLRLPAGATIVYSGALDPIRRPDWMLDVLARVRDRIPDAVLLVLSYQDDDRRRGFEEEALRRGADIRVVGPLHHRDTAAYLGCADVMLCALPPSLGYNMSSPTKSIEALGLGLPVVGNSEVHEHATVLPQSGGGLAVPWSVDAFADAIVGLLRDPELRRAMGERGRRWALEHRSYPRLTAYLEGIVERAAASSAPRQPTPSVASRL